MMPALNTMNGELKMYHGRFKGTHYDAGYKWGSLLLKKGKKFDYCPAFALTEERYAFAKECTVEYQKYFPEILEEIQGIAEKMQDYRNPDIDDWRSSERYQTAYTALIENKDNYTVKFAQELLAGKYGFMCQFNPLPLYQTVLQ